MILTRRGLVSAAAAAAVLSTSSCATRPDPLPARGALPSSGARGGQLIVAAHPDDDLFFMNPDLLHAIGTTTTTVYATAGDAGDGYGYYRGREIGVRSAYARMADVEDSWSSTARRVAGMTVDLHVLRSAPRIRLLFLHLPDGGVNGDGFRATGDQSLLALRSSTIPVMQTIDGRQQAYTASRLTDVLGEIVRWSAPDVVRTLDFTLPLRAQDDHADHRSISRFARDAVSAASSTPALLPYRGYPVESLATNVRGEDLRRKEAAFLAYATHDSKICDSLQQCGPRPEGRWLERQYRAGS